MSILQRIVLLSLFALASFAAAQTPTPPTRHSYLQPGDSLWTEISLEKGDVLTWNLYLSEGSGETTISFESDAEGKLWNRRYSGEPIQIKEEFKPQRSGKYRFNIKNSGERGRLLDFTYWTQQGSEGALAFPPPSGQRTAVKFAHGDKYAVEFEFIFKDTLKFETLRKLELPPDLVRMWTITPLGDSINAVSSVRRWTGDAGKISLLGGASPKGGRQAFRLELDPPEAGEMTVFVSGGSSAPPWLPKDALVTTVHAHDPWGAVVVPPFGRTIQSRRAAPPDFARAKFALQSLRINGADSLTLSMMGAIYAERDSFAAVRRERLMQSMAYDSVFLRGSRVFSPPEMHVVLTEPLVGNSDSAHADILSRISYYAQNPVGQEVSGKIYEWRYDEGRAAMLSLPTDLLWDSTLHKLDPQLKTYLPAIGADPQTITQVPPRQLGKSRFDKGGIPYINSSQRVLGLFFENTTTDTLYLVYSKPRATQQTLAKAVSRWPKGARLTALVLLFAALIAGVVGLGVFFRAKTAEQRRRKDVQELAADLEKARTAQLQLLPKGPLLMAGLEVLGFHQSMQQVGGDYYDFFPLEDGRVMICVADVTGHGYKAALIMSNLQATLRALAVPGRQITEMISALNLEMYKRTSPEDFVTMAVGVISADRSRITMCNAGHNPVYIIRATGQLREVSDGGIMLGVLETYPYLQSDYPLYAGDMICFYTDGIPEATLASINEMFGYDRMKRFLVDHHSAPIADIARDLISEVTPRGGQSIEDDMAIVLVRVKP